MRRNKRGLSSNPSAGSALRLLTFVILPFLAGCAEEAPPKPGERFKAVLHGVPVELELRDCEVFLITDEGKREQVLTTDFYPMFSLCMRHEISADPDFVRVTLGRQALGAGGCCATGGTWRSRDGRLWERREGERWVNPGPVSENGN